MKHRKAFLFSETLYVTAFQRLGHELRGLKTTDATHPVTEMGQKSFWEASVVSRATRTLNAGSPTVQFGDDSLGMLRSWRIVLKQAV